MNTKGCNMQVRNSLRVLSSKEKDYKNSYRVNTNHKEEDIISNI